MSRLECETASILGIIPLFESCSPGSTSVEHGLAFLNVGEPWGHLSNNVADVMLRNGVDPNVVPVVDTEAFYFFTFYSSTNGRTIWNCDDFFDAGNLTRDVLLLPEFALDTISDVAPHTKWDAEVHVCSPFAN